MKVKELIELLQKLPQDDFVFVRKDHDYKTDEWVHFPIYDCKIGSLTFCKTNENNNRVVVIEV